MRGGNRGPAPPRRPGPENGDLLGSEIIRDNKAKARRVQRRKELPHSVSVYDGLRFLGRLIQREHGVEAVLADGQTLGIYNTESAAAHALIAAQKGATTP